MWSSLQNKHANQIIILYIMLYVTCISIKLREKRNAFWKTAREKQHIAYRGTVIQMIVDRSSENIEAWREEQDGGGVGDLNIIVSQEFS